MTNQFCNSCKQAYNAINGRYCILLDRYVERRSIPPCSTQQKSDK